MASKFIVAIVADPELLDLVEKDIVSQDFVWKDVTPIEVAGECLHVETDRDTAEKLAASLIRNYYCTPYLHVRQKREES